MICQACGGQCARYDEYRVCCRQCHQIWTLPEHADKPLELGPEVLGSKPMVRLVKAPRFPAWLPGTVLGGLALIAELVQLLLT